MCQLCGYEQPGIRIFQRVSGTMMNFIKNNEDAVSIKQIPKRMIQMQHGLIG